MTLFNFDSTSAVVKFGTLKIAVFINDLDFMFPAAECKGFILFKFEDSAEGRDHCLLLYAGKLPSSGAEEVSGLPPKCKACLRPQSRGGHLIQEDAIKGNLVEKAIFLSTTALGPLSEYYLKGGTNVYVFVLFS